MAECTGHHTRPEGVGIAQHLQASRGSNLGIAIAASKETPGAGHFKLDGSLDLSRGTAEHLHLCSLRDGNDSNTVWPRPRERGGCVCMGQLCKEAVRCFVHPTSQGITSLNKSLNFAHA